MVKPAAQRQAAQYAQRTYSISERRAGRIISIGNASLRYRPRRPDDSSVRTRLKAVAADIEEWREDYNVKRPHSSLDHQTPKEFARRCALVQEAKNRLELSL